MAEWIECKICDIGTVVGGATPSTKKAENYECGNIAWITPKDLSTFNGRYIQRGERNITEIGLKSCSTQLLPKNTVLFSSRAPIGYIAIAANQVCTNQGFKSVIPNEATDPLFLFYLLKYNKDKIEAMGSGTTFKEVSGNTMKNIIVRVPSDKEVQKNIASILGTLDNKIEENERINNNLYDILNLSYTELYLNQCETHPEWNESNIGETTSKFATGLNPIKNFKLGEGNNYYVTIKNMANNRIYLDSKCDNVTDEALIKINKRSDLQIDDCLFSGIGTIGRVHHIHKTPVNWNISESIFTLRANEKISSQFLYLLLLSDDLQNYTNSLASGSAQKGIRKADFVKYKFKLPDASYMKYLTDTWEPIINLIHENEDQNDTLISLRDQLLPKLMSGEIDVSVLDI